MFIASVSYFPHIRLEQHSKIVLIASHQSIFSQAYNVMNISQLNSCVHESVSLDCNLNQ